MTVPILLHLDSSADLSQSVSRRLTERFARAWADLGSSHTIVRRDLHVDPLPHLPTNALHWAARLRPGQSVPADAEQLQADLIAEVGSADVIVIGAPLYNWSMPSTLKAWIDYIQVGGLTSPYDSDHRPFAGKPVVIVSSRGDEYGPESRNAGTDHEIPALRQALGVALGMSVRVVTAELTLAASIPAMAGLRDRAEQSERAAEAELDALVTELG
jgi:FMN-dependent NADH-azoreductase